MLCAINEETQWKLAKAVFLNIYFDAILIMSYLDNVDHCYGVITFLDEKIGQKG